MILGFNKSPGAYIDIQHPENISERMSVTTSDLMNIYALHRMRNMEPNYIQMKIKNVSIASFYTGFSFKHYVGRPDYAITVFLTEKDNPSADFEGMLRRLANDLLPQRGEVMFDETFEEYYENLRKGELEPYWAEFIEGEGSKIATIQAGDTAEQKKAAEDAAAKQAEQLEELNFDDQFEKYEKDELKEEIKDLRVMLTEKNEKIRELTKKITERVSEVSDHAEEIQMIQTQLDENNAKLDDWALKLADLNEKNTILMETVRKLTEMSMQQTEEMERQGRKLIEQKKLLEKKDAQIAELNNKLVNVKVEVAESNETIAEIDKLLEEIENLKSEKSTNLDSIEELKKEIKESKERIEEMESAKAAVNVDIEDQIIELKKDLKVVRRERDHYKNIVQERDLLDY